MREKTKVTLARVAAAVVGVGFLAVGILNGEFKTVLHKAIIVCLECIGIG